MGDGQRIWISESELKADIDAGTAEAAERARIPELSADHKAQLLDIITDPAKVVSVQPGEEVIVTDDGCSMSFYSGQDGGGVGIPMSRMQAVLAYERACAADTTSIGHSDYSFKPVKPIINFETNEYYNISMVSTAPLFYGAQPNMGLYFQPDGPCPNPSELLPHGKIDAALAAQEEAAQYLTRDLVFVGKRMAEVGCEGLNFDTSGSAGDADFFGALCAVQALKKAVPDMPILMGASGEFVIGMHGQIAFKGQTLAGLYPHEQARVVADAGADIFGLAIGTNTTRSVAWNLARAVTFLKETTRSSPVPVHANVGMGVCGIPMLEQTPIDSVTRVSKALVQIGKADGL